MENRKIIHIDMDAFYASIEQRDHPEWRGKPLIIGGSPEERGVVSTCSYEARVFGIHSAMPTKTAVRLCPDGIFQPVDMPKYKRVSGRIQDILHRFSDRVEPVSIDEAYLDVTENAQKQPSATLVARAIQRAIYEETMLTASAGVSYNKFLAKIASDLHKPCGLTVITPKNATRFLEQLPIEKFHGIGRATAGRLKGMGVKCGGDLKKFEREALIGLFGKNGSYYYDIVRGIDLRPVETEYERKSYGREITFPHDLDNLDEIVEHVRRLSGRVAQLLAREGLAGRTVTLKVRYENFQTVTRSMSVTVPVGEGRVIAAIAEALLKRTEAGARQVRLLGVTMSNFPTGAEQNAPIQLEFDFDAAGS
ncbi:DNA polymerase IV [Victivallis sp. Marseille-Q1083]|uniref:DNA polymerase IV n=1 Tax=Victivallis sp. Marseille-Q1083 TaxID=2717288 RepID=UPI00158F1756|nr:DNA polymerase IV [Victivallis sp. Marseille-Q1083]